jgi:hypothetical protein
MHHRHAGICKRTTITIDDALPARGIGLAIQPGRSAPVREGRQGARSSVPARGAGHVGRDSAGTEGRTAAARAPGALILVDTSVWMDHLRRGDGRLVSLLDDAAVLTHAFVISELACGSLAGRRPVLGMLHDLPRAATAETDEVLEFIIERHRLWGQGIRASRGDVHMNGC